MASKVLNSASVVTRLRPAQGHDSLNISIDGADYLPTPLLIKAVGYYWGRKNHSFGGWGCHMDWTNVVMRVRC